MPPRARIPLLSLAIVVGVLSVLLSACDRAAPTVSSQQEEKPAPVKPAPAKPGLDHPAPAKPGLDQPPPAKPGLDQPPPAKPGLDQPAPAKPALEKLTGDKVKDKATIIAALQQLKGEWDQNQSKLDELLKGGKTTNPDPAKLKELKDRNDTYKARAVKLQELLDKLGA